MSESWERPMIFVYLHASKLRRYLNMDTVYRRFITRKSLNNSNKLRYVLCFKGLTNVTIKSSSIDDICTALK